MDSDEEFERFLQQNDDSASFASATSLSPVKKRSNAATRTSASAAATGAKDKSGRRSSTAKVGASKSSKKGTGSVMEAAEKLLRGSGRSKKKDKETDRKTVLSRANDDEEEDEPPPSYSDDPYAFDLGTLDALDNDLGSKKPKKEKPIGKAKSSKTSKTTKVYTSDDDESGLDVSEDSSRKEDNDRGKKAAAISRPKPQTKTLEERMADILKRTGSTAFPMGVVASGVGEKAFDHGDEEVEDNETNGSKQLARLSVLVDEKKRTQPLKPAEKSSSSDNSGDDNIRRLSLSDSLGIHSADFEVGAHSRRKLERSRMSLSSMNSEKFAVNVDALDESELVPASRYDERPLENFRASTNGSEAADSEDRYGDDDFELDQTAGMLDLEPVLPKSLAFDGSNPPEKSVYQPGSSSENEFEKMKSMFSLDSPVAQVSPPVLSIATSAPNDPNIPASIPPEPRAAEDDTFGYDEDDFEDDESRYNANDGSIITSGIGGQVEAPLTTEQSLFDYGDDEFEDDIPAASETLPESSLPTPTYDNDLRESQKKPHLSDDQTSRLIHDVPPIANAEPIAMKADSSPERSNTEVIEPSTSDVTARNPPVAEDPESYPLSPPPPPPPDDDEEQEMPMLILPQPIVVAHASVLQGSALPERNATDHFHRLENRVSSLRFDSPRSMVDLIPTKQATVAPKSAQTFPAETVQMPDLIPDSDMAEEMKEIESILENVRMIHHHRRRQQGVRLSTSKESELALRLQQAQRQILHFKQHVQNLAMETDHSSHDEDDESSEAHHEQYPEHSVEKMENEGRRTQDVKRRKTHKLTNTRLQKEVESQDRLIQGFQRENEQLMIKLKRIQREMNYDVHRENESLKNKLRDLQSHLDGNHALTTSSGNAPTSHAAKMYHSAVEARLQAEAHSLSLIEEMETQRRQYREKLNEMSLELEKVKKAKREVECRYEGIDLKKVEAESLHVKKLEEAMQTQKTNYEHSLSALQKKLDWYVGNQRILDAQDERISALKAENERLQNLQRTNQLDADGETQNMKTSPIEADKQAGKSFKYNRSVGDIRRIRELESRLSEMEEAMRKRHPDSLVSLIVASRKADNESKIQEIESNHDRHILELEDELEQMQLTNEKKLKSFRQQQEKLVAQFQKRVSELEDRIARSQSKPTYRKGARIPSKANAASTTSVNTETEISRVRRFYTEKIKELERKWEAKLRALKKQSGATSPLSTERAEAVEHEKEATTRMISSLQNQIRVKDVELTTLRRAYSSSGRTRESEHHWNRDDDINLRHRVSTLEAQLAASEDARQQLLDTLESLHATNTPPRQSPSPSDAVNGLFHDHTDLRRLRDEIEHELRNKYEGDLEVLRREYETKGREHARDRVVDLEAQIRDQSTKAQTMQHQFGTLVKEVERLQIVLGAAEKETLRLSEQAARLPAFEAEVKRLHDQLAVPQTPSMVQFHSLELRIEALTQRHALRESELQVLLDQATRSNQLEKLQWERRHQSAIALKNAEIKQFKQQLDEILDELELLRESSSSSPAAPAR